MEARYYFYQGLGLLLTVIVNALLIMWTFNYISDNILHIFRITFVDAAIIKLLFSALIHPQSNFSLEPKQ